MDGPMRFFMPVAILSVILVFWPFHHKKPVPTYSTGDITIAQPSSLHECDRDDDGDYIYVGSNELLGVSQVSCDAAYEAWRHSYTAYPANNRA